MIAHSSEVSKVLGMIQDDERKVFEAELEIKGTLLTAGRKGWMGRPVMSAFCGVREDQGEYLLKELKNSHGECDEWTDLGEAPGPAHECASCVHRRDAKGATEDAARESRILEISRRDTSARVQSSPAPGILTGHRENVALRQANEVRAAYYGAGSLAGEAKYLATCARLSRPGSAVVCAMENRWNTCNVWEPGAGSARTSASGFQEGDAVTDRGSSDQPPYEPESAVAGASASEGESAEPAMPSSVPGAKGLPAALAASVSAMLASPPVGGYAGSAARPGEMLAPGLERRMLERIVAAYEWLLGIRLSDSQRQQFSLSIIADVSRRGSSSLAEYQQAVLLQNRVPPTDALALAALREQVQPQAVWTLRQMSDATAVMLVEAYDAANPALAAGVPPLTQEMVDCYLALLTLVEGYRRGRPLLASEAERALFTQQLAAAYPSLPSHVQSWIGALPAGWTAMVLQLRNLPPEQTTALVTQIDATLQALGPIGPRPAAPLPAVPVAPAHPAHASWAPVAPVNTPTSAPESDSVDAMLAEMMAADDQRVAELRKTDPDLAIQEEAANSARYATILSNISQMRHQTAMTIAGNIK